MSSQNVADLSTRLARLTQSLDAISEVPEQPRSTMDVIEYGLGNQQRAEVYVNRLLTYFLDPTASHGMGEEFLRRFLQELPASLRFDEDLYDLSDVRVNEQVSIEDGETRKYPDVVVDVPGEWFLLIELKFSAAETGTEFYGQAPQLGDQIVAEYESGHYYLYLHQRDKPTASSSAFANWTWLSFVEAVLDTLLTDDAPRYPQRTAAQLHELKDDLASITGMSDKETATNEKIELFIEHADAIEAVSTAFDEAWESYSERWDERLADALVEAYSDDVQGHLENTYPEVTVNRADAEGDRWILRATGGDWQHLHKYGWYKHAETFENLADRAEGNNDLRIGFYHRMGKHRDAAIHDQKLHVMFRNMGSNPSEFKDIYSDRFDIETDRIREMLAETNATLTGNKLTKITATYELPVDSTGDFFEAYTKALREAFDELIIDQPELIQLLDTTFEDAIVTYQEGCS